MTSTLRTQPMTLKAAFVTLLAPLVLLSGCAAKRIPGTELEDNDDNRAVLKVMDEYRRAVERRDAEKVLALLAPAFKDDGGTPSPEDDLDFATLKERLPQSLARLDDVRLDISVRRIAINKADDTAKAVYTYNTSFRMPGLSSKPVNESEIKEMHFVRVSEQWRIVSGI